MMTSKNILSLILSIILLSACVSKKKLTTLQSELDLANKQLGEYGKSIHDYMAKLSICEQDKERLKGEIKSLNSNLDLRVEQIDDLKDQISDIRNQRDKQVEQVGDLTVLSQSANENIKESLQQLEYKDKYINLLQSAKTKADSINLALAVNLKQVLRDGIEDRDINIQVDKTVVFINLSDKMLYRSGRWDLSTRAYEVLGKIAKIIQSRPGFEVMVEGYTDNVTINNSCIRDNWDLSVKRATSVVRALQDRYKIDPNRLIAAGRGEFNTLATNDTKEGRAINRRTRIIILPKLNQFYDLLNPDNVPK